LYTKFEGGKEKKKRKEEEKMLKALSLFQWRLARDSQLFKSFFFFSFHKRQR